MATSFLTGAERLIGQIQHAGWQQAAGQPEVKRLLTVRAGLYSRDMPIGSEDILRRYLLKGFSIGYALNGPYQRPRVAAGLLSSVLANQNIAESISHNPSVQVLISSAAE